MTDPNIDLYCTTDATACRNAHCIVCRYADNKHIVTVPELHARLGVNPQIVDTYVDRIQPRQSPIIIARFGGAA